MSKRFYFDEFSEDIFDDEIQQYPSNQTICNILNQQQELIADLEAKLAETREFLKIAYEDIDELQKENDKLEQQLEKSDAYKLRIELAGADEAISQLKQQLAEKEKEIEEINKEFVQSIKDWKELVEIKEKNIAELEEQDEIYHNQDKIELLEKVRTLAFEKAREVSGNGAVVRYWDLNEITNALIEEIKGE